MTSDTDSEYKVGYAVKTTTVMVVIALSAGHITLNCQLALGVFLNFFFWSLLWFKILLTPKSIYSVRVPTTVLPDWIQISLPSCDGMKIRKDRVVTSISELSGIRGGMMMLSLRVMTVSMNMIVLVTIHEDLHHRGSTLLSVTSREDLVPIFMLIQALGFFLTGHFELNYTDHAHSKGHYIGVMGILIGSLSIGFVLSWNTLSIILISLEYGLCVIWTWYSESIEKRSKDIDVVTYRSKVCIGIELVMFWVTNVILVIATYACGKNEGNMWASPFL